MSGSKRNLREKEIEDELTDLPYEELLDVWLLVQWFKSKSRHLKSRKYHWVKKWTQTTTNQLSRKLTARDLTK